ncbi:MAG: AraC family transcriptional regulator [Ruminococcaceae bacterium]|nr:AraC family transcriptional regulator [Oscillospiraceae bacterium]
MNDNFNNDIEFCRFDRIFVTPDENMPAPLAEEEYIIEKDINNGFPFHCHSQRAMRPGMTTSPHIHEFIEILYCTAGEYHVTVGGKGFQLKKGDLIIINSNEIHEASATAAPAGYTVIKFSPELLSSTPKSVFEYKYMLPFTMENSNINKLFKCEETQNSCVPEVAANILEEFTKKKYGFELAVRSDICRLFLWILRRWKADGMELDFSASLNESTMLKLQSVFEYIEQNPQEDITLEKSAALCGFSASHFSRVFKRATGKNFTDYVNAQRISAAQKMLVTTELNITEIAMECGFASTSYFIKKFRDKTGVSPKKYRAGITE